MNRFQFVEDDKDAFGVKRLCEVIEIARSSFYAWAAAAPTRAAKAAQDAAIAERIKWLQDRKRGGDPAYGAPRITDDLNEGVPVGQRINRKRVVRVMRQYGLAGIRLPRLWARVKQTVTLFLRTQWREGALPGVKEEEAFTIAVGRGKMMSEDDILNGRLIVEIGIAPVRPAEFVVFRVFQKTQESKS